MRCWPKHSVRPNQRPGTAIVYAPTRKSTEEEAARLKEDGWRVDAYHAGMTGPDRDAVQCAFMQDQIQIVVATNAFGMGIEPRRCARHRPSGPAQLD